MLTFEALRQANEARACRWHPGGIGTWPLSDWAVAMVGEAGEACNIVKKLNRVRDGIPGNTTTEAELHQALGYEIADTLIYLDLLAARAGIDLAAATVRKFNIVSERQGFPERLPLTSSELIPVRLAELDPETLSLDAIEESMTRRGRQDAFAGDVVIERFVAEYHRLKQAVIDEREFVGQCEACRRPILVGERGHACADGPYLCEDHAPTWGDIKTQIEECGDSDDNFSLAQKDLDAHLAAGGALGDKILQQF